ncbi:glycerate kinase [Klebsiella pneumoniae]
MKIVIALDSFKGSCSAQAACAAVAQGLRRVDQTLELVEMPVSDGGEGLLSTLADSPLLKGAVWQQQRCTSPYGLSVQADFLILPGERAIIEMAQSCGLELTPPAQRDVRQASSYGLGEQVKAALDAGCRHLIIGLGGSATNDGGIGFAQALGARFWRKDGTLLPAPAAGQDLAHIQRIDLSGLDPRLQQSEIQVSCDVTNPLLGEHGATWVATPAGQEALHRLLELGFDFDTPRVPIVVTVQVEQHQLSDILSTLLREFSQLSGVSDVILLGSHEILILNALSEAQETLLRGIEFVLSNHISHYYIGIGVQADSAPDIREAIRFARSVIEVGSKVQPQRQIYYFREMAMLCLFRVLEDSYMVNFFINNVRQLLEHDSGEVLLDTLSSFIANNAEPGKTSLLLGIHRNTLTYRLQQIKKHIQLDPMVFTDLTQLAVSVHCYRRLNPRQSEWIDSLS